MSSGSIVAKASLALEPTNLVKAPKDGGGTHTKTTIFLRNLPFGTTSKDLEQCFSEYGPIRGAFPVVKKVSEELSSKEQVEYKGIGFVHFALAEDAKNALEAIQKGLKLKDRTILGEAALRKNVAGKDDIILNAKSGKKKKADKVTTTIATPSSSVKKVKVTPSSPIVVISFTCKENNKKINFDKKQLYKKMRKTGDLQQVIYPLGQNPLKAKLLYSSPKEATKALKKLNNHIFKGFTITVVDKVDPKTVLKAHRLIVRNLPFSAQEAAIKESFLKYGTVLEITLPQKSNNPGQCRGFAFVQMAEHKEAEAAMNGLNGKEVAGRIVAVDYSVNKTTFEKLQNDDKIASDAITPNSGIVVPSQSDQKIGTNVKSNLLNTPSNNKKCDDGGVEEEQQIPTDDPLASIDKGLIDTTTVFIRNVSFASEEDDLSQLLSKFGQLEYVKIVRDPQTGASKGTAFAKFHTSQAASEACKVSQLFSQHQLDAKADLEYDMSNNGGHVPTSAIEQSLASVSNHLDQLARKRTGKDFHSIMTMTPELLIENLPDDIERIVMDGRALSIVPAVDRKRASQLKKVDTFLDSGPQDRRNLYLLNETCIKARTDFARKFWPSADVLYRESILKERKRELKNNPNLFISTTRLSLRHLPPTLTEADIKKVLRTAVERALAMKPDDDGSPIIDDKRLVGLPSPFLRQVKIIRGQNDRSKGYGFAEWGQHIHALLCVRYLTNIAPGLWKELLAEKFTAKRHLSKDTVFRTKAPVVEFSTEKTLVIEKRNLRLKEQASSPSPTTTNGTLSQKRPLKLNGSFAQSQPLSKVKKSRPSNNRQRKSD